MTTRLDAPIAADVVAQASHWLMLHWGGDLNHQQRNEFDAWHAAHHEHQRAWQRLQQLQRSFATVPADTTLAVMRDLPDRRRRQLLKLLGLMLMFGGGLLAERQLPWREAVADLRTGSGGPAERKLPDGSRLQVNSGSAVNILFSTNERRIRLLSGEVLITSGKDAGRPYRPLIVETPAGDVHALGTRFSVYEIDGGSRVQLYEGALEVRPRQASAVRLQAHQQLWFAQGHCSPVTAADANAIAWIDGRLVAERTPLGQFLNELSRHRPGFLRCDPQVVHLPLTGVFPLNDSDRVLQALEQALPIKVQRRTRYWVTVTLKG